MLIARPQLTRPNDITTSAISCGLFCPLGLGVSFIMGAGNDTDFLNSDFPMYAAGGVTLFIIHRAFVVSFISNTACVYD